MFRCTFLLISLCLLVGCDAQVERFESNNVHALALSHSQSVGTEAATADVASIVSKLFGSPDQPRWPANVLAESLTSIVSKDNLSRSAGAVASDKVGNHRGLFREHCTTCHAFNGSGAGPAAMLQNPYPRDFRAGIYKWKSTERAAKPTRADLLTMLSHGVPGTAMPSFALIAEDDRAALIDYVIYLSIRGEVERKLLDLCVYELGYDDQSELDESARLQFKSEADADDPVITIVNDVAGKWSEAADKIVPVVPPGKPDGGIAAATERGRQIFHGQIANCVGCHGPQGNGQAVTLDFDDWTKEYSTRIGLTPTNRQAMKPFRNAGALRPRQILPRNLQDGVFRGGGDNDTLYRRISQGIAGTPMPTVEITSEATAKSLSSDQVWDLIRYLRSLGSAEATANAIQPTDESQS